VNKKLVSLVTMTAIMFTSVSPVFAKNFESKQDVALNHAWTVKFNKQLNSSQDFSKVTIKDSNGNVIPLDVVAGSDEKSITVTPKSNYSSNTNYTLTVDGIKDNNGKALSDNATMQFTTVNDSTNPTSSIIKPELLAGAEGRADRSWDQCFGSVKDQNGNSIPLNSYALGQVYTYEQARKFDYEPERNKNSDFNDETISGLGWQMKFDNNKLYVEKNYPINVTGLGKYDIPYYTSEMVRYTNPINPLAEQQIYNLVSNVGKTDDNDGNKYTFIYNSQYDTYKADTNGNLVKVKDPRTDLTDFYLQLMSNSNNPSTGCMDEYGEVVFLENPYTVNGINYNLKFGLNSVKYPNEATLLLTSIVGSKFGNDLENELLTKYSNKETNDTQFTIDNIKCYVKGGWVYISY